MKNTPPQRELSQRLYDAGVRLFKGYLTSEEYMTNHGVPRLERILNDARGVVRAAPLFVARMKNGTVFKYQMSNCGIYGWIANPAPEDCVLQLRDEHIVAGKASSYAYTRISPYTSAPWPKLPVSIRKASTIAARLAGFRGFHPQACLLSVYLTERQTLGLHQDNTEANFKAPIVSLSIGDTGIFRIGGASRNDKPEDIVLENGDCLVMGGASRNFFHSFLRLIPGTSSALEHGGRLNLTIRQVF